MREIIEMKMNTPNLSDSTHNAYLQLLFELKQPKQ